MFVLLQLDPQTLQNKDWQRTVIGMNGVSLRHHTSSSGLSTHSPGEQAYIDHDSDALVKETRWSLKKGDFCVPDRREAVHEVHQQRVQSETDAVTQAVWSLRGEDQRCHEVSPASAPLVDFRSCV